MTVMKIKSHNYRKLLTPKNNLYNELLWDHLFNDILRDLDHPSEEFHGDLTTEIIDG